MTQTPPPSDPFGQEPIGYYSGSSADNAPTLIRLAVIFNYVSVGLDVCLALLGLGVGTVFLAMPGLVPQNAGDPPPWLLGMVYLVVGVLAVSFAVVKTIATRKVQARRRDAWGWGLAAGIIGCGQLMCASCCCLQVAVGIYTIVILCLGNVRACLAANAARPPE